MHEKQQILQSRSHLTGADVESNGFALSFHRSQVVGNKLLHLGHRHVGCCSLKLQPLVSCIDLRKNCCKHNTQHLSLFLKNLRSRQLLCCDPQDGEDGGEVFVPDLVEHLVLAGQLQLGGRLCLGHLRRELDGAAGDAKGLVKEAFVGERREEAGGPARKGQSLK